MKNLILAVLALISISTSGCGPQFHAEVSSKATTTWAPSQPTQVKYDNYSIIRGSTSIREMNVLYNRETKEMTLKGQIEFLPRPDSGTLFVDIDLKGFRDHEGFIVLHPQTAVPSGMKLAAKATCLGKEFTCTSSFIDIYLQYEGRIFHHQLESHQAEMDENTPEKSEQPKDQPKPSPGHDDHKEEDDVDDGEPGLYVGTVEEDIEKILNIPKGQIVKDEEEVGSAPSDETMDQDLEESKEQPKDSPTENPKDTPKANPKETPKEPKPVPAPQPAKPKQSTTNAVQAIGKVNDGHLEYAADFLKYVTDNPNSGLRIMRPQRNTHFASNELIYILKLMGQFTVKNIPGMQVTVGDLSYKNGGRLGTHKSHQNGLDADIAFYFKKKGLQGRFASAVNKNAPHQDWMLEEQWEMFKRLVNTKLIDRIFIHRVLKKEICGLAIKKGEISADQKSGDVYQTLRRLIPDTQHNNHFHLRVKCSKAQIRCRQMADPVQTTGCF